MRILLALLVWLLRAAVRSRGALALENLALRQQLATYARRDKRPRLKPEERAFVCEPVRCDEAVDPVSRSQLIVSG